MMPNMNTRKSIGLIATGDELTQGHILNTNGQTMVLALNELGFDTTEHFIVSDEEQRIVDALNFFRARHNIIIITGGLGPTSDDRTRYALAKSVNVPLEQNEPAWQLLKTRLEKLKLPITEENRQQALLPVNSEMLPNTAGTAAGCYLQHEGVEFFMLPGPPSECLPMFSKYVLPTLVPYQQAVHKFNWLLLNANEGKIAAELDAALHGLDCRTGYRWHYPYLDYKVFADSAAHLTEAAQRSLPIVQKYLVSQDQRTAEELLKTELVARNLTVQFANNPLSQLIHYMLIDASTYPLLVDIQQPDISVELSGFPELWQACALPKSCEFILSLTSTTKKLRKTLSFYYRDNAIKEFLTAVVAKEILAFIQAQW